jgi:hypothetical protein
MLLLNLVPPIEVTFSTPTGYYVNDAGITPNVDLPLAPT